MKYLVLFLMVILNSSAFGALKGHLAQLPVLAENKDKGILVELVKALARASETERIDYVVLPFNQSLNETLRGQADFHMPLLKDPTVSTVGQSFNYSKENLWQVKFALYTNKSDYAMNPSRIAGKTIETEATHVQFFPGTKPSTDVVQSLKRVDAGDLDGFIFAALECDDVIKKLGLNHIVSHHFKTFDVKFIVPKGKRGDETGRKLDQLLGKIKSDGSFDKIMAPIVSFYSTWKPTAK